MTHPNRKGVELPKAEKRWDIIAILNKMKLKTNFANIASHPVTASRTPDSILKSFVRTKTERAVLGLILTKQGEKLTQNGA
jgi:hypothetical protein